MTTRRDFRHDIQFLRGVAVLLVVLYHAFEHAVPRGFLGVDVFFAISGFLVTAMIVKDLDAGRFSLKSFYLRRVKRIVPAALSTLIATTFAGYFVLTAYESNEFLRQLVATLLFATNFLLMRRDGYFGPDPAIEPLRHFWSLAVEEQFYLAIPILLMILAAGTRLRWIAGLAAASLLLCIVGVEIAPIVTFYSLPTRAWELLAGACCGIYAARSAKTVPGWVCWLALGALLGVSLLGFDGEHPRGDALIVVIATCLMLLSAGQWLPRSRLVAPISRIGDWSYSLYLLHWPILSFTFLVVGGNPSVPVRIGAVLLSILLAGLQYRAVELPFWQGWHSGQRGRWPVLAAMAACVPILALPVAAKLSDGSDKEESAVRFLGRGLPGCARQATTGLAPERCRTSARPRIALYGDSNVLHLFDGIRADPVLGRELIQFTHPACAPVLDVAVVRREIGAVRPRDCIGFNRQAVEAIERSSVRVVVLSSPFTGILYGDGLRVVHRGAVERWTPVVAGMLAPTIARLTRAGKVVVIVAPIPRAGFDPARCHFQRRDKIAAWRMGDCHFRLDTAQPVYLRTVAALRSIASSTGSHLFLPEDALCEQGLCRTAIAGRIVYADSSHLTAFGSRLVIRRLGLDRTLRRLIAEPSSGEDQSNNSSRKDLRRL